MLLICFLTKRNLNIFHIKGLFFEKLIASELVKTFSELEEDYRVEKSRHCTLFYPTQIQYTYSFSLLK